MLASLRSYRPDGCDLALMALLVGNLMLLALPFTTPADIAAIADGNVTGFWVFLLVFSALSGFVVGVLDTTKRGDWVATLPHSQIAALITRMVFRLVRMAVALALNAPAAALVVVVRISQRFNPFISIRLPLFTPDLWPTGATPRLIYEPL